MGAQKETRCYVLSLANAGREQELCIDKPQYIVLYAALAILGAAVKVCLEEL